MAFGCEQADPRAFLLEERIGRHSRAMHDTHGLAQERLQIAAEREREPRETVDDSFRRIRRRGGRLRRDYFSAFIDCDQVRECTAYIDSDPVHARPSSAARGPPW